MLLSSLVSNNSNNISVSAEFSSYVFLYFLFYMQMHEYTYTDDLNDIVSFLSKRFSDVYDSFSKLCLLL